MMFDANKSLVANLAASNQLTTHEALANTSTFEILKTWWDTSIALSTFASSTLLALFTSFTIFFLRNHYKTLNERNPFVRPLISSLCVIAALCAGWIIQMMSRNSPSSITYFSISISPVIGRWAFEGMIHGFNLVSKGLIYVIGFHFLGLMTGFIIANLIIYFIGDKNPAKDYSLQSTFGTRPLSTKMHFVKNSSVWLIVGATVPFCGYFVYISSSSGNQPFSPLMSVFCALAIMFIMMVLTHRIGYYDGNMLYSVCIQLSNIFILKNKDKKQIYKNIPISITFALGWPFIWGIIYGVLYNNNI